MRLLGPLLVLVGITLPFEHTAFPTPVLVLTPNKIVTSLMLAMVTLLWVTGQRRGAHDPKRLVVIFLAFALTLSAVQSAALDIPLDQVRRVLTTWLTLFLFYFILIYLLRDRRNLDWLLVSFVAGCTLAVVSGWAGYGFSETAVRFGTRIGGEGGNPNLLAFNLLIAIAASGSLYFGTRRRLYRLMLLVSLGIMGMGVATTGSRSGIVCLAGMMGLWFLRYSRAAARYALPILLIVITAVALAPEVAVKRLSTLTPEGIQREGSAQGRLRMWTGTAEAFLSNPITGVGLSRYKTFADERNLRGTNIHSAYLQVLAENGLLAFIPFVGIIVLAWREFGYAFRVCRRKKFRADPELGILELRAGFLQIGLAGILVQSLAQPSMRHKGLWMMFALATVVSALVRLRVKELEPGQTAGLEVWTPSRNAPLLGVRPPADDRPN